MITKFLSLAGLITSAALFSLDQNNPQDPIFFVVSGGQAVEILRIFIALFVVMAVFARLPNKPMLRTALKVAGIGLTLFGVIGSYIGYVYIAPIKPVDFLMITEAGIILSLVSLSPVVPVRQSKPRQKRTGARLAHAS
jgi:preprotein translocase subunit Sss1